MYSSPWKALHTISSYTSLPTQSCITCVSFCAFWDLMCVFLFLTMADSSYSIALPTVLRAVGFPSNRLIIKLLSIRTNSRVLFMVVSLLLLFQGTGHTMRRGRATSLEHVSGSTPLGPAVLPLTGAQGMGQQVTRALALNTCQVQHSWALNTWQVQHSWALGPAVLSLTGAQVMWQQVARPGGTASRS